MPGGFLVAQMGKNLPAVQSSFLELDRAPGEGNGNPLQFPCLEKPMDRGAWWAKVHGVAKSWTQLNNSTCCVPGSLLISVYKIIPTLKQLIICCKR